MINKFTQKYAGISQDITLSKTPDHKYWMAKNMRISATDSSSTFSMTNEHGNEKILDIPIPVLNTATTSIDYVVDGETKSLVYKTAGSTIPRCQLEEEYEGKTSGTQTIIGVQEARDSVIIATTDDAGFDCFWELLNINSGNYQLSLLYMNNLVLSSDAPLQIVYNYENSLIEKIYFVDGVNQLRFMNIRQSLDNGDLINLIDMDPSSIDTVSNFELSQPVITNVVGGGNHTAGMIQYAYGLYVLNGSQTTISPLSEIKPIDKGPTLGGGDLNENLGKAVLLEIPEIDQNYTHIKIYALKYTSYNQVPQISVVSDREIDNYSSLSFYDDGSIKYDVSLEQFLFLGSSPKVPEHLATKDSRMFLFNIKEKLFNVDLDMRAYGHDSGGNAKVWENLSSNGSSVIGNELTVNTSTYSVPKTHDAINRDYPTYKYQSDGSTLGATGKYINVEIIQNQNQSNPETHRYFKDNELYRIGIKFYNGRGQATSPFWVMDLIAPEGNLEGKYNQLGATLTPDFYTWLADGSNFADDYAKPVGYKILRADRKLSDKTILAQGMINPMVSSTNSTEKKTTLAERTTAANQSDSTKMPSLTRVFQTESPVVKCKNYHELAWNSENDNDFDDLGSGDSYETYKAPSSKDWKAQTLQYNQLMQLFSPEISFQDVFTDSSLILDIKGMQKHSELNAWCSEENFDESTQLNEAKFLGGLTQSTAPTVQLINGELKFINDKSWFGASDRAQDAVNYNQIYREFDGGWIPNNGIKSYQIFGTPEVSERGADFKPYNGDNTVRYGNTLRALIQDDFRNSEHVNGGAEIQVVGSNSYGERNITFMEGTSISNAKTIEQIKGFTGIAENRGILIAELRKPNDQIYVGSSYGGNNYESKSTTTYLEIGEYADIDIDTVIINSPGDTYVQSFNFVKLSKTDTEVSDKSFTQTTEIVQFPVETTVDLKNRNDLSLLAWDNRYHARYDEYANYNDVYTQQPISIGNTDEGFKFKEVSEFDTRVQASKQKIAGENIDSWTDYLENEVADVDGKYGPINAVVNWRDEIFTFQDTGVARLAINPRVQTTGDDGLAIELGRGTVLYDYDYQSTTSGCLNKWGVKATEEGFYYFDLLNKAIYKGGQGIPVNLTDDNSLHQFMVNNIKFSELVTDLPAKGAGVTIGYNTVNKDVYFSFNKSTDKFTLVYNEKPKAFVSMYDYIPAYFINKGERFITSGPDSTTLWEHFRGERCNFYGTSYDSSLIFNVNAKAIKDATFNNLMYRTEVLDSDGNEAPNTTLKTVRIYNEYQDSGTKDLIIRKNLKKRNRTWTAELPRHAGTRDRIKSPWAFVEVTFSNDNNDQLILHDIDVFFTTLY